MPGLDQYIVYNPTTGRFEWIDTVRNNNKLNKPISMTSEEWTRHTELVYNQCTDEDGIYYIFHLLNDNIELNEHDGKALLRYLETIGIKLTLKTKKDVPVQIDSTQRQGGNTDGSF